MPVKKDDSGRRWVEMEFLVPGTPEQVWHAIATGPGMSRLVHPDDGRRTCRWRNHIRLRRQLRDPRSATVTAWEPPTPLGVRGA